MIIKKENWILTVGRLIKTKHHDRLIRIFSRLNAPGWKFIIIGGDALKQNNLPLLYKLVKEFVLTGSVIFTGNLSDIDEYYYKSKIFAFTSSSEGFPNVVGEALSAGLPVVSYDCVAGPSEMITDGENGFLVPVFDDDLFRKRLQQLIDDEGLRQKMSAKAPASVERYAIEKIGKQYLDFILP
ncbi:MAG: glycosyltransferase family 4 protein [Bacteroidales bacterium]|nr:glycosyltransferase family 4 protein [Bacteroidales bacterium]